MEDRFLVFLIFYDWGVFYIASLFCIFTFSSFLLLLVCVFVCVCGMRKGRLSMEAF